MATAAQIIANQNNAQSSTGPQTPEGKTAASRNATTHGLHAVNPVLPHESQAEFDALHASYREELEPDGLHEGFLVRQVAEARWRLDRLQKIEAELMDILATGQARQNPHASIAASMLEKGGADALSRLHRLAGSADRAYHRNYNALTRDRRERRREAEREMDQAACEYIFALPGRSAAAAGNAQNEANRPAAASSGAHPSPGSYSQGSQSRLLGSPVVGTAAAQRPSAPTTAE